MNTNNFHRNDGIGTSSGTDNNNSNSNSRVTSTSSLEAKLQTAAVTLRQKRDEAHRTQQLALERLRLVRQEADSLQNTVADLQSKLEKIQNQAGGSSRAKEELANLYKDVDMLTKEVTFQHNELTNKRAKTKELQVSMHDSATKYNSARSNVEKTIRERRMKLIKEKQLQQQKDSAEDDENYDLYDNNQENVCNGVVARSMDESHQRTLRLQRMNTENRVALNELLDADEENRLLAKWPDIIQTKTTRVRAKSENVQKRNTKLQSLLLHYQLQSQEQNETENSSVMTSGNHSSETVASFANESCEAEFHPLRELTKENLYPSLLDTDSFSVDMKEAEM